MIRFAIPLAITLTIVLIFAKYSHPSSNLSETYELTEGRITEYLPITMSYQFELTTGWLRHHYPYGKTDFSESERMIIYRALSSFAFYGYSHPWSDAGIFGVPPVLYASSEYHKLSIYLIKHREWGSLALVFTDDEPDSRKWFTVDSDAFDELVGLIR